MEKKDVKTEAAKETDRKETTLELIEDEWMIRPCLNYLEEFKDCKSLKGRFYQHFVDGEKQDCSRWEQDYDLCIKFRKYRSRDAAVELVEHEKQRRAARLNAAASNNVWEYRTKPPKEWDQPLPEHLHKMKLPEMDNNSQGQSMCSIS